MAFVARFWARPLIAGDALAFYLWKLAVPLWHGPDYGHSPAWVMGQWWFYFAWLVPAAGLAGLASLKDRRAWLTAAGVSIGWLLPVLGLVTFDFQRISTVADRYVYLALLGPALALSWLLARRWNPWTIGVTGAILCLLGALSFVQSSHWRNNHTLIEHGLRVNPRSVLAKQHRGTLFSREGNHQEAIRWYRDALEDHPQHEEAYNSLAESLLKLGRVDDAEKVLRRAAREIPMRPPAHKYLADLLVRQGEAHFKQGKTDRAEEYFDQAERHYREASRLDPQWSSPYCALGRLRFDRGAIEEAIGWYRKAIYVEPSDVEARVELAKALTGLGKLPEAMNHYRVALQIRPQDPRVHFNLANFLKVQGKVDLAQRHYREALKYRPNYAEAHVGLGIVLFGRGAVKEAIGHYREALRINPELVIAQVSLGHALAAGDRHREAEAAYRAALKLVPSDSQQADQIRQFLRKYEKGK